VRTTGARSRSVSRRAPGHRSPQHAGGAGCPLTLNAAVQALTAAFEQGDLAEAATLTKQLRYITRIGEAIRDKG